MPEENNEHRKQIKSMHTIAIVNVAIWAVAIITMIFLMKESPGVKKIFPVLGSGVAVGLILVSALARAK
jgi:hypothetical protein